MEHAVYCSAICAGYTRYLWHRAANAIRSGGGRNPIGWRTETDWVADGIRWQREHFQGALLGGTLVSSAPTKQTGRVCPTEYAEHTEPSGRESLPQIDTDAHRLGGYGIPAIPTQPITQPNHLWKSVGEYYHAHKQANGESVPQNTQNLLAEKASHR